MPAPAPSSLPPSASEPKLDVTPVPAPSGLGPVVPQLKLDAGGGTTLRFGLLWHLDYEARGNSDNHRLSQNLFLRRFSVLFGGTVLNQLEYFVDTDFADVMKAAGDMSTKNGPGISLKDAFVTYIGLGDVFKLEGGLLMPAVSHNVLQGGGSQLSWDFFFNSFRHSNVFGAASNTFGRDLGGQARGLLAGGAVEYRLGVFQGKRDLPAGTSKPGSRNPFRVTGRVQINLLDPETGFFYAGTYLGKKRILSFGASYDYQPVSGGADYKSWAVDGFLDLPAGPGGVTAQVNVIRRDGGALVDLPKQTALMAEAGYRIDPILLSPIVRFEKRWAGTNALEETDVSAGLAFWAFGHTSNLKAFYTRIIPRGSTAAFDQFNVQWQLAFF